nr:F-box protein At5g49610-like [Lolium perenne]
MLPADVVDEILLRLPAKSIARFRAACKSWHALFSDRVFLRAHHDHASRAVLLRKRSGPRSSYEWDDDICALPFGQRAATPIGLEKLRRRCRFLLHGCCDGLLLLSQSHRPNYSFLVYNPTTQEHVPLPRDLNWNLAVAGFYFHAPTAEYRVLCYRCDRTKRVTRKHYDYSVAAVGRPEVRRLASTTYGGYTRWKNNDAPVILHGSLHWMRMLHRLIVFDTVSERFRGMRGPMQDRCMVGRLVAMDDGKLGASSFAEGERTVDVWVLRDYRKETSWTLRYKVDVGFMGGSSVKFKWLGIAHVSESGEALFYGAQRYGMYNLREGEVVKAGRKIFLFPKKDDRKIDARLSATWHAYRESLVSPVPKDVGADPGLEFYVSGKFR